MDFQIKDGDNVCFYSTAIFKKEDNKTYVCCKKHGEQYLEKEQQSKYRKNMRDERLKMNGWD